MRQGAGLEAVTTGRGIVGAYFSLKEETDVAARSSCPRHEAVASGAF